MSVQELRQKAKARKINITANGRYKSKEQLLAELGESGEQNKKVKQIVIPASSKPTVININMTQNNNSSHQISKQPDAVHHNVNISAQNPSIPVPPPIAVIPSGRFERQEKPIPVLPPRADFMDSLKLAIDERRRKLEGKGTCFSRRSNCDSDMIDRRDRNPYVREITNRFITQLEDEIIDLVPDNLLDTMYYGKSFLLKNIVKFIRDYANNFEYSQVEFKRKTKIFKRDIKSIFGEDALPVLQWFNRLLGVAKLLASHRRRQAIRTYLPATTNPPHTLGQETMNLIDQYMGDLDVNDFKSD